MLLPSYVLSFIDPAFGSLYLPGTAFRTGGTMIISPGIEIHRRYGHQPENHRNQFKYENI